jgi:predicted transposase YdaD
MEQTDQLLGKSKTMGIFEQLAEIKHQEGVQEGKQEGIQEGLEKAVRILLANTDLSPSKIAEEVGVRVDLVEKIKIELSAK